MPDLRLGALEAGRRAGRLSYDSLWTWDHEVACLGQP